MMILLWYYHGIFGKLSWRNCFESHWRGLFREAAPPSRVHYVLSGGTRPRGQATSLSPLWIYHSFSRFHQKRSKTIGPKRRQVCFDGRVKNCILRKVAFSGYRGDTLWRLARPRFRRSDRTRGWPTPTPPTVVFFTNFQKSNSNLVEFTLWPKNNQHRRSSSNAIFLGRCQG